MFSTFSSVAVCLLFFSNLAYTSPTLQPALRVNTPPGRRPEDVVQAVRRGLGQAVNQSESFHWKGNTSMDRSWDGAVLLKLDREQSFESGRSELTSTEGIEIVCTKCYVKGLASAELSAGHFNMSRIVDQTVDEVGENFLNFTSKVFDYIEDLVNNTFEAVGDQVEDAFQLDFHDIDAIEMPTLNYSFAMDIPALPDVNLRFGFDTLELYMMLDTTLSLGSTYTYRLYTSKSPIGVGISEDLELGVIFSVDLILAVDAQIDISSGFHIKLDDGLAVDIALFGKEASGISFNGGQIEFLRVTVESAGGVFTAVLRLGVHAGFAIDTDFGGLTDVADLSLGAGIEVGVFANVAEFTTNVTYDAGNSDCELSIEQTYQFALGAAAGASIAINDQTWGPAPETSTPIFYTTMASACAMRSSPTLEKVLNHTTPAAALADKRQDMSTATITTEVTYTGVNCLSTGLVNCPASLQNTSQSTATSTFTTVVPSGTDEDEIVLPARITDAVATTVTFGANAIKLPVSSGSPVSYIPPPPTATNGLDGALDNVTEHATDRDVIVGVSVGIGGPSLIVITALCFIAWRKRQNYTAVTLVEAPDANDEGKSSPGMKPRRVGVHVTEIQPLFYTRRT